MTHRHIKDFGCQFCARSLKLNSHKVRHETMVHKNKNVRNWEKITANVELSPKPFSNQPSVSEQLGNEQENICPEPSTAMKDEPEPVHSSSPEPVFQPALSSTPVPEQVEPVSATKDENSEPELCFEKKGLKKPRIVMPFDPNVPLVDKTVEDLMPGRAYCELSGAQ